jgi:FlaA1/EpsC-like NDP-sugar epimerase
MIKDNQRHFNRLHVVIDAVAAAATYLLAWVIRFLVLQGDPGLPFTDYCWMLVPLVPYTLFVYFAFNLYTPKRVKGRRLEAGNVVKANLVVAVTVIVCLQIFNKKFPNFTEDFSRMVLFIFCGLNIAAGIGVRNFIRYVLWKIRRSGYNLKHILLVGYSRAARIY